MGKVTAGFSMSLDGFVANESHTLDGLFEVPYDVSHTTRGVASIITREGRARCDRAVLEKPPRR